MFDRVIVGVGEYERGRDALALAEALVSDEGEIVLVCLADDPSSPLIVLPSTERRG
jgi:hypothetical protein